MKSKAINRLAIGFAALALIGCNQNTSTPAPPPEPPPQAAPPAEPPPPEPPPPEPSPPPAK